MISPQLLWVSIIWVIIQTIITIILIRPDKDRK